MACERVISAKRQTDQGKRTGGEGVDIFRDVVNFQQRPKAVRQQVRSLFGPRVPGIRKSKYKGHA